MITDAVLREAVGKGLVSAGQAEALRSLARQNDAVSAQATSAEPADDEKLRFVSGFGDIFVTIGLVLFLGSAAYLADRGNSSVTSATVTAALAWGLAEFFTRRKRMALPSIVLLLVFAAASFSALTHLVSGGGAALPRLGWLTRWLGDGRADPLTMAAASLGTAGLTILHYWRFRVPITIAAGTGALALTVLMLLYVAAPDATGRVITWLLFLTGVCVFALAMRFDLTDRARQTRRTDIAFWLHLLAAPLIVHSVFAAIGVGRGSVAPSFAPIVLLVFLALGLVAVLVDRRALLVSGLAYAGFAFGSLIASAGLSGQTFPLTLLALGAFVLALSAGWTPLRRLVLDRLPDDLAARLRRPVST